jgi:histidinol-phosphate aminotransferase
MLSPRSTVATLPPAIHGARNYTELQRLGLNPDNVIDFSTNSNPYGPHPAVLQAVREAVCTSALAHYPDRDCLSLRAAIAAADGVSTEHVLPGNGATELIHLIALTFVKPDSCHLILAPTFGEYARAIHLTGGNIYEHRPQTYANLHLDPEEASIVIQRLQPDGIWLCNPNNPTGQHWTTAELSHLYAADPDHKTLWIIDESYRHFVKEVGRREKVDFVTPPAFLSTQKNIISLRSLTKDYNLAGLRLGYALAAPEVINTLRTVQPAWSVNTLAQVAGVAALQEEVITWRQQSLAQYHQHTTDLWAGLTQLGLTVLPTSTSFALVPVQNAPVFRSRLLSHGLLVRDCTSFGLPEHIRIAARQPEDNGRLLTVIERM